MKGVLIMGNAALRTTFRYPEELEEKIRKVEEIFPISRGKLFCDAIDKRVDELLLTAEILERVEEIKSGNAETYTTEEIIKEFGLDI